MAGLVVFRSSRFNPQHVVVMGQLSPAGECFFHPARRQARNPAYGQMRKEKRPAARQGAGAPKMGLSGSVEAGDQLRQREDFPLDQFGSERFNRYPKQHRHPDERERDGVDQADERRGK